MEKLKAYQRGLILAPILAIAVFLWILFHRSIGGVEYWSAITAFAIYVASGSNPRKLPWMLMGTAIGVILGLLTIVVSMLVFPMYALISSAIAGAIFILVAALISAPKTGDILPMATVGWASFLAGIAQFMRLIGDFPVWAMPKAIGTFFGVLLALVVGLLFATLVATPLLGPGKRERAGKPATQ